MTNIQENHSTDLAQLYDEQHLRLRGAIDNLRNGRPKHHLRNAFRLIQKSWDLYEIDKEMSGFSAITAEEEAASALLLALKEIKYPSSELLNFRNHNHKNVVWPIAEAIWKLVTEVGMPTPKIYLTMEGRPKVAAEWELSSLLGKKEPLYATLEEPLDLFISSGPDMKPKIYDFQSQLESFCLKSNSKNIREHIERQANLRNQLLYATEEGIPTADFKRSFILCRLDRIYVIGLTTIAVLQTRNHQALMIQCALIAAKILKNIEGDFFSYYGRERFAHKGLAIVSDGIDSFRSFNSYNFPTLSGKVRGSLGHAY